MCRATLSNGLLVQQDHLISLLKRYISGTLNTTSSLQSLSSSSTTTNQFFNQIIQTLESKCNQLAHAVQTALANVFK